MKIEKAIEILDHEARGAQQTVLLQLADALKLGIEALKRCEESKYYSRFHIYKLLPGETKG